MTYRIHAFITLLLFMAAPAAIAAGPYDDAYREITPAQQTQFEDKIEVVEIFWYGCPHCYDFEPHVERWQKNAPEEVAFRRMPAVLNQSWLPHAKAYYTAAKLGVLEQIHEPLFNALHAERKRIFTEDALKDFFVSQGVDGGEFTRVYNSNEVETRIKQAYFMARNYKVTGVPTVVVNGKYLTSASMAGSYEKLLRIMDYLVQKEKQSQ